MNNAFLMIRIVGLSNAIKIFDTVVKNTYVEIAKILPEMGDGALNIILQGSISQIREAEILVKDIFESRDMEFQVSVITNFDFTIINKDENEVQFNKK